MTKASLEVGVIADDKESIETVYFIVSIDLLRLSVE